MQKKIHDYRVMVVFASEPLHCVAVGSGSITDMCNAIKRYERRYHYVTVEYV